MEKEKNKKSKGQTSKKSGLQLTILFPLMKTRKIYWMKTIISENHSAAPEGKWISDRGIEITSFLDQKSIKNLLERKYKIVNVTHFSLL